MPLSPFGHNSGHARPRRPVTISVSDTVTAVIGHRLGKTEAVRRLKEGFARTDGHLGAMITVDQETWQEDTVRFRMRALGQTRRQPLKCWTTRCASKCRCLGSWRRQRNAWFQYCARKRRYSWRRNRATPWRVALQFPQPSELMAEESIALRRWSASLYRRAIQRGVMPSSYRTMMRVIARSAE